MMLWILAGVGSLAGLLFCVMLYLIGWGGKKEPMIYVASSWRNFRQPAIVCSLRRHGYRVYDFRNPKKDDHGFHWSQIDEQWKNWSALGFIEALSHPIAKKGFQKDWNAMCKSDACVLLMPCGRSAHLEAGYFVGAGKPLVILTSDGEPELMYNMANSVCWNFSEALYALNKIFRRTT